MRRISETAQETRVPIEAAVVSFGRLGRAVRAIGADTQGVALTEINRSILQTLALSGSNTQEGVNALIQLSQAIASNRLSGDELRSISENLPRLAQAIAAGQGIGLGQLRERGQAGLIGAQEIIESLINQADVLNREFARVGITIDQAGVTISNALASLFSGIDDSLNASEGVVNRILDVGNAIEAIDNFLNDREPTLKNQYAELNIELEEAKQNLLDLQTEQADLITQGIGYEGTEGTVRRTLLQRSLQAARTLISQIQGEMQELNDEAVSLGQQPLDPRQREQPDPEEGETRRVRDELLKQVGEEIEAEERLGRLKKLNQEIEEERLAQQQRAGQAGFALTGTQLEQLRKEAELQNRLADATERAIAAEEKRQRLIRLEPVVRQNQRNQELFGDAANIQQRAAQRLFDTTGNDSLLIGLQVINRLTKDRLADEKTEPEDIAKIAFAWEAVRREMLRLRDIQRRGTFTEALQGLAAQAVELDAEIFNNRAGTQESRIFLETTRQRLALGIRAGTEEAKQLEDAVRAVVIKQDDLAATQNLLYTQEQLTAISAQGLRQDEQQLQLTLARINALEMAGRLSGGAAEEERQRALAQFNGLVYENTRVTFARALIDGLNEGAQSGEWKVVLGKILIATFANAFSQAQPPQNAFGRFFRQVFQIGPGRNDPNQPSPVPSGRADVFVPTLTPAEIAAASGASANARPVQQINVSFTGVDYGPDWKRNSITYVDLTAAALDQLNDRRI